MTDVILFRDDFRLPAGMREFCEGKNDMTDLKTTIENACDSTETFALDSAMASPPLGVESTISNLLDVIKQWLEASDIIPSRDDVLKLVGDAFDTYIAVRPPFAGHPVITKLARAGLLSAVAALYDAVL